ncbi:MAG: nicotinamide-nucleotide amidohydrolase family protein [Candidatus Lokiarchaeota archaeon]|nr:nicotinamide-nucleotide amidohydrolase family protein [Candidatus Lokiarchaeota archaeon]
MEELDRIGKILDLYAKHGKMIAFAESCTGGYICHMITNISGSSKVFERGIVCYSNEAKMELLGVKKRVLEEFGAVSEPVAQQLCEGIRNQANVDVGIGITGIAGPTGGTPEKPVGLVYIGFSSEKGTKVIEYLIEKDRIGFKMEVLNQVLVLLEDYIEL